MIALVDSDIVCYRCAASCVEEDPVEAALVRVDKLMRDILEATQSDSYMAFLTGSYNFRKEINKEYKANRKDMIPPKYLQDCREYMVLEWNAKLSYGHEADDDLGINQTQETIICSIDKDLLMIPGKHFNFVKQQWYDINEADGNKHFWKQMLIGDKSDNIIGVSGLGPVKSERYISPCESDQECLDIIIDKYDNDYDRIAMNAACLWIKRSEDSEWQNDMNLTLPSELQHAVGMTSESMKSFLAAI